MIKNFLMTILYIHLLPITYLTAKYKKRELIKLNFKINQLIQLHFKSRRIELNKIKELIELGGDVNSVNKSNGLEWTILHYAVIDKNISLVKFLIEHKVNVNAKNSDGLTPLWYSINQKTRDISLLLMEAGGIFQLTGG
jgi:ankyrin repeat protein